MNHFYKLSDDHLVNLKSVDFISKGQERIGTGLIYTIVFYQGGAPTKKVFQTAEDRDREFDRLSEAIILI